MNPSPQVLDYLIEANNALLALDGLESRNTPDSAAAVNEGVRVFRKLVVLQRSRLTPPEAVKLQIALNRIRERLKFLGVSV